MSERVQIRVVVFDLGGVMIRLADGWEGACRAAGVPYRAPLHSGEALRAGWLALEHQFGAGRMSHDDFFDAFRRLHHAEYTLPELQAAYHAIIREEQPGIAETVAWLKAAGYRTACLSNTSAPHWVDLDNPAKYPAIGLLHVRYASHLLGAMKPDSAIYRAFEAAEGAQPGEILFFDDYQENIDGARACGWHAARITGDRPVVAQMADHFAHYGVG